jgi:hypothetical protein
MSFMRGKTQAGNEIRRLGNTFMADHHHRNALSQARAGQRLAGSPAERFFLCFTFYLI